MADDMPEWARKEISAHERRIRQALEFSDPRLVDGITAALGLPSSVVRPEVLKFAELIARESDRGCALTAASILETDLGELLGAFFIDNLALKKRLLEDRGPLADFSARIDVAYAMGLLSEVAHHDLHLVRRIRNDFAHSSREIGFETPRVSSRCNELRHLLLRHRRYTPRERFTQTVLSLLGTLHGTVLRVKRRTVPADPLFGGNR